MIILISMTVKVVPLRDKFKSILTRKVVREVGVKNDLRVSVNILLRKRNITLKIGILLMFKEVCYRESRD